MRSQPEQENRGQACKFRDERTETAHLTSGWDRMSRIIDRIFCGLLAIGAAGHLMGTFVFSSFGSELFVWSLSGVLAAALLAALNTLRNIRPEDTTLAWVALVGSVCWIGIALLFGQSIGNIFDPRVLFHAVAAAGLSFFSLQTVSGAHSRR